MKRMTIGHCVPRGASIPHLFCLCCIIIFSVWGNVYAENVDGSMPSDVPTKTHVNAAFYPLLPAMMIIGEGVPVIMSAEIEIPVAGYFSFPFAIRCAVNHSYGAGAMVSPGFRVYPRGEDAGLYAGLYYETGMLATTEKIFKAGYVFFPDPREFLISTGWVGYRWKFDRVFCELATGVLYCRWDQSGYDKDEADLALPENIVTWSGISFGVGIGF